MNLNLIRNSFTLGLLLWLLPQNANAQSYFPATGIFNGFLNQTNISECDNTNSTTVNITMTITDSAGSLLATHTYSILPSASAHIILNDLASIADKIGTYTLTLPSSQAFLGDSIFCRTSFYHTAAPGSPKTFDFSYVLPIENPKVGNLSGIYNSIDPSNSGNPTNNWLSVINRSTTSFDANVQIRDSAGALVSTVPITSLAPTARTDIQLGAPGAQVTGVYTIEPSDPSQLYDAVVIRYNPSAAGYNYAFPLQALSASCSGDPVAVATMNNGATYPWVENANLSPNDAVIDLTVRDRNGAVLYTEQRTIAPYQQYHFFAGGVIDPAGTGNVGTVQVACADPTDQVITQATHYGRDVGDTQIRWAYSSQVRGNAPADLNSSLTMPVNTFAGIYNWGKLSDSSGNGGTLDWDLFNYLGVTVASGANGLAAGGSIDHDLHTPMGPDSIGFVKYTTTGTGTQYNGEVLRVTLRSDNSDIATITPIPGIVKQNGSSGSFVGNPQSLAPYRDRLTTAEAVRLLNIAKFGGSADEIQAIKSAGLKASVDAMISCVDNSDSQNIPSAAAARAYDWLDGTVDNQFSGVYTVPGLERYWLEYMQNSTCPLKEKLAQMLYDRFALNATAARAANANNNTNDDFYVKEHIDRIRTGTFGSFRTLSRDISTSFVMLAWLNGNQNKCNSALSTEPDQNWARENWELFTGGEKASFGAGYKSPIYTELDIARAAGAAAGYTTSTFDAGLQRHVVNFSPTLTCDSPITLWEGTPYETTASFDARSLATSMFDYRPLDAGRYLGTAVFNFFCHDDPSEPVKNQLAQAAIANGWNVMELARMVLKSEACFSVNARNSRVKDPLTFLFGFQKALGMELLINNSNGSSGIYTELMRMTGNVGPLTPSDVFGFKELGNRWKDAQESQYNLGFMVQRINAVHNLYNHRADTNIFPIAFDWCAVAPGTSASAEQVVDHLAYLFGTELTTEERNALIQHMDYVYNGSVGNYTEVPVLYDNRVAAQCKAKISAVAYLLALMQGSNTY